VLALSTVAAPGISRAWAAYLGDDRGNLAAFAHAIRRGFDHMSPTSRRHLADISLRDAPQRLVANR
jgi:hypothetical protein